MLLESIANDDEEEFSLALDHGITPNKLIKDQSLLHLCAINNSIECLLALISRGADIDPIDSNGYTPLLYALEKRNKKMISTLIELGADIERR